MRICVCVHARVRVCVSLCVCVYASEGWRRPEEGTDFPGAGIPGAGELSSVGGGNSVQEQEQPACSIVESYLSSSQGRIF